MHETCTVYQTLDYMSKRWMMLTLFEMRRSGDWIRFSDLKNKLGDITPKILSERLKEMEQEGLIEHRVDSTTVPIKSEYRLTPSGLELTDIILDIKAWALKWKIDNRPCENMNCCKCRLRGSEVKTMAVENEYKFISDGNGDSAALISELESYLSRKGIPYKRKSRQSMDYYFDSEDMSLFSSDCSLRKKISSNGKIKLTAKRPISKDSGLLSREEIERLSDGSFKDLKSFAKDQFPSVKIEEKPALCAQCERTAFDYRDGSGLMLSFDVVRYVQDPYALRFYEIELESMDNTENRDFDEIGLIPYITDHMGFEPATGSKYRRGIQWKMSLED
jgi:DNA-binding HxlR family transcriptional regulator/uncharacterized protein YjbK